MTSTPYRLMSSLDKAADLAGLMLRAIVQVGLLLDEDGLELEPAVIEDLADLADELEALRDGRRAAA